MANGLCEAYVTGLWNRTQAGIAGIWDRMEAYEAAGDRDGVEACFEEQRRLCVQLLQDLPSQLGEHERVRREQVIYGDIRCLRRYARDKFRMDIAPLDQSEIEACRARSVPIPEAARNISTPDAAAFFGGPYLGEDDFAAETPEMAVSAVEFRRAWTGSGKVA